MGINFYLGLTKLLESGSLSFIKFGELSATILFKCFSKPHLFPFRTPMVQTLGFLISSHRILRLCSIFFKDFFFSPLFRLDSFYSCNFYLQIHWLFVIPTLPLNTYSDFLKFLIIIFSVIKFSFYSF